MDRRELRERRIRRQRRRAATVAGLVVVIVGGIAFASCSSGSGTAARSTARSTISHATTAPAAGAPAASHGARTTASGPASLEAGVSSWQLPVALSRTAVVAHGSGLTVLGGLTAGQASVATVYTVTPGKGTAPGTVTPAGTLPDAVHDAAAAALGSSTYVLGGGSPNTVATIQSVPTPPTAPATPPVGTVVGALPRPRSDLAVATVPGPHGSSTAYIVGGYDGTTYQPSVLATTDGTRYRTVATLPVPVRYPAVVAAGGIIYAFGGQTASAGTATTATDAIQAIDPATHRATVVGHLPQSCYGSAAFVIDGTIYVAGGQVPGGPTLTTIDAFVPATHAVLNAGLLPQATAFAGYATVGTGAHAVGWMVGGEVAAQAGKDQAGIASGTLDQVLWLKPSPYGGPAGVPGAGAPYRGTFLIADRGNNRLIALDRSRNQTWVYPSPTMPAPPGGFYFPDDSFFIHHGTGIISNQEDNHTIVQIAYPSGKLLWQYGHPLRSGGTPGFLNQPDDAYLLPSGTVTVADASNNRIVFLSPSGQVTGQIGNGKDAHVPGVSVAYPNGDTPLANGNILVSEIDGSWISEYTPAGKMVWAVQMTGVNYPSDPQQLGPDLYLMTDYNPPGEGKVLTFTRSGSTPWVYDATAGDARLKKPSLAERYPSGVVMVNDDYRHRLVGIDPGTNSIVWQYGLTDVPGTAPGMLNTPDGFDNLLADGTTPTHQGVTG